MPTIKASPTKSVSNCYAPPPLSTLPERVAMIVKSKENKYTKILKYYEYRADWSILLKQAFLSGSFLVSSIYTVYQLIRMILMSTALPNFYKKRLLDLIFFNTILVALLYLSISSFFKWIYPGAIFLTDTGILFIPNGYSIKYEFIPYTDIKTIEFKRNDSIWLENLMMARLKIQFFENFSEYERKGVKYIDKVNSIFIEKRFMLNRALNTNAFQNFYTNLLRETKQIHIAAMREKAEQIWAQGKGKSLLEIKKEQEGFIDRLEDSPEELHAKIVTIQTNDPAIFTQVEAYYPHGIDSYPLIRYVLMELAAIAALVLIVYSKTRHFRFLYKAMFDETIKGLLTILLILVPYIYYEYDLFMHPAGLFITDTGFLFIKAGKKLKYTFVRYKHIKELLRDVNHDTILVRSTQSTHEAGSLMNGAVPQTIKIECHLMKKEIFDALYEHFYLKIAEVEAGKSRLAK